MCFSLAFDVQLAQHSLMYFTILTILTFLLYEYHIVLDIIWAWLETYNSNNFNISLGGVSHWFKHHLCLIREVQLCKTLQNTKPLCFELLMNKFCCMFRIIVMLENHSFRIVICHIFGQNLYVMILIYSSIVKKHHHSYTIIESFEANMESFSVKSK